MSEVEVVICGTDRASPALEAAALDVAEAVKQSLECVHAWVIESPDGRAELPAKCKRCKATTTFAATGDYYDAGSGVDPQAVWRSKRYGARSRFANLKGERI